MNIATVFRTEIGRVARKELRGETLRIRKGLSHYRAEIAALKRRISGLERMVKAITKPPRAPAIKLDQATTPARNRFSPAGLAKHRKRLGLNADDMGFLIGVAGQTIYKWESERASPRASQLPAIRATFKLGKREVASRLANR